MYKFCIKITNTSVYSHRSACNQYLSPPFSPLAGSSYISYIYSANNRYGSYSCKQANNIKKLQISDKSSEKTENFTLSVKQKSGLKVRFNIVFINCQPSFSAIFLRKSSVSIVTGSLSPLNRAARSPVI